VVLLTVVLLVSCGIAVSVGTADMSLGTVAWVVAERLHLVEMDVPLLTQHIVWQLRTPRVAAAALVGAGLAVGGAVVQSLTRNALADPYLLGVSAGSALGAVAVIVAGTSGLPLMLAGSLPVAMTLAAFAGGLGALAFVLALSSRRDGALHSNRLILVGVAIGQLCAAGTSFLVLFGGDTGAARRVVQWTLGSVAGARWPSVAVLAAVTTITIIVILPQARTLDAFAFGERSAASLGIGVKRSRWVLYIVVSLLTAALVSVAGIVGFLGLIVPHAVRLLAGPLHRRLLPLSALAGAIFLVWADVLGRVARPDSEIPLGIVTAVIGVPFFVVLLRRRQVRL
jgi:iron complex transport system permease protein